jgi:MFS transporter, Spinster family, sphingosine-1-phosphate transporter
MTRARPDEQAGVEGVAKSSVAPSTPARRAFVISRALWVFWLMFAINLFNYLDRMIAVAVGPTLKAEFHLTNRAIGVLSSAFVLIYTVSALPLGALADRARSRARVVALGVGFWSIFSGLTALARGFGSLVVTRALVGVGEASYYPAGTALLSAYYPRAARARVMGRWQTGQMVGILLAFALAGALFALLPAHIAWRVAFLVSAIPGLALAGLMWFVADPRAARVASAPDGSSGHPPAAQAPRTLAGQVSAALRIPSIWIVVILQAIIFTVSTPAITFLPIYVSANNGPFHLSLAHASFLTGIIVVVGGVLGALLGGPLADWLTRRSAGGRVLAVGVGLLLALPCYAAMLLTTRLPVFALAGLLAVLALYLPTGPLTAITQDVAPAGLRATAVAVTMLLSHILGDIWAPTAVGALSTALHEQVGPALLMVGAPALLIGCAIAIVGARLYARNVRDAPEE